MGAVLACCALDAGISDSRLMTPQSLGFGLVTGTGRMLFGWLPWGKSQSARFMNAIIFITQALLIVAFLHWGDKLGSILRLRDPSCGVECFRYYGVYRLGGALWIYHLIQALSLVGVQDADSWRARIQDSFWPLKFLLLFGLSVGSFWISPKMIDVFFYPFVLMGGIFLLIQAIILIDLAYNWAEGMQRESEDGNSTCATFLILSTIFLFLFAIFLIIGVYLYFKDDFYRTIVTVNSFLFIMVSIFSVMPQVQEANPSSGLFQSSLMGVYSFFLLLLAFSNQLAIFNDQSFFWQKSLINTFSMFLLILSIIKLAFTFDFSSLTTSNGSGDGGNPGSESNPLDEDTAGEYDYCLFHLVFCGAACYVILYFTDWKYALPGKFDFILMESTFVFWVRTISSWLSLILFGWSLFAPIVLEERLF